MAAAMGLRTGQCAFFPVCPSTRVGFPSGLPRGHIGGSDLQLFVPWAQLRLHVHLLEDKGPCSRTLLISECSQDPPKTHTF